MKMCWVRYLFSAKDCVFINVYTDKDHDIVREEARELMRSIQAKSVEYDPDRKVSPRSRSLSQTQLNSTTQLSLIVEYIPGRVTDSLDRLIALYRPDSLIVGTRGKRGRMSMSMSMSLGAHFALISLFPWSDSHCLPFRTGIGSSGGGIGSVSKYCLSHSPVPVIVVRPERKVKKVLEKRRADPKRGRHFE
jgi:nucleotide-binding universal stress UspA family protein